MSKYELITELCESRVFRSKQAANSMSSNDRTNMLYASLLATIAGSLDSTTSAWAREYAGKTAAFGNFDFFRPSATDLYVALHLARPSQSETGRIIRLLRSVSKKQTNQTEVQQVLLRLERSLRGVDQKLKTARRTVVSWANTSPAARKQAVQNIILTLNSISRRSEVLPYMKTLKGGPRGHFGKASTLKKAAALAGIGLAGFALGRKMHDPNKRFRFSKPRESIELGVNNIDETLLEDRATQLAFIAQKLPEHPAVEKLISVNYLNDGISAFVRTVDGNAYEFEIRPAPYAKGHGEKRGLEKLEARITEDEGDLWEYKVVEVDDNPDCEDCNDTGWMTQKEYDDTVRVPCQYCDAERTTDRFDV